MIKSTTIIKRMFSKNWRPFVGAAIFVAFLNGASHLAEYMFGYDAFTVYWSLAFVCFVGFALKWSYDLNKLEIQHEQERILRDLGKQNDKN